MQAATRHQQEQNSSNIRPISSGSQPYEDVYNNTHQFRHQRSSRSRLPLIKHLLELEAQGLHQSTSWIEDTATHMSDPSEASLLSHSHPEIVAAAFLGGGALTEVSEADFEVDVALNAVEKDGMDGVSIPTNWETNSSFTPPLSPTNSDLLEVMNNHGFSFCRSPSTSSIAPSFFCRQEMATIPLLDEMTMSASGRGIGICNTTSAAPPSPVLHQQQHHQRRRHSRTPVVIHTSYYSPPEDDESEVDEFPSIPSPCM